MGMDDAHEALAVNGRVEDVDPIALDGPQTDAEGLGERAVVEVKLAPRL